MYLLRKPSESLDHLHQFQRRCKWQVIVCMLLVFNGKNQTQKFLVGTEIKIFMIQEELCNTGLV